MPHNPLKLFSLKGKVIIITGGAGFLGTQFVQYEKYPIDLWKQELMVNLTGMMICTKAVAPIMMKQKSGSIVNIASELSVTAHDYRFYDDPKNKKYKSVGYTTKKSG